MMISSKAKALVVVTALLFLTSFIVAGCSEKEKQRSWVNSKTMPGSTFKAHNNLKRSNSSVIYLGSSSSPYSVDFGPKDISFDFKSLK